MNPAPIPPPPGQEKSIRLQVVVFLYTLDQVAAMLNVSLADFKVTYCYYHMRNTGPKRKHHMMARNIAPDDALPDWRISQEEFRRWLMANGFKVSYGTAS